MLESQQVKLHYDLMMTLVHDLKKPAQQKPGINSGDFGALRGAPWEDKWVMHLPKRGQCKMHQTNLAFDCFRQVVLLYNQFQVFGISNFEPTQSRVEDNLINNCNIRNAREYAYILIEKH